MDFLSFVEYFCFGCWDMLGIVVLSTDAFGIWDAPA